MKTWSKAKEDHQSSFHVGRYVGVELPLTCGGIASYTGSWGFPNTVTTQIRGNSGGE